MRRCVARCDNMIRDVSIHQPSTPRHLFASPSAITLVKFLWQKTFTGQSLLQCCFSDEMLLTIQTLTLLHFTTLILTYTSILGGFRSNRQLSALNEIAAVAIFSQLLRAASRPAPTHQQERSGAGWRTSLAMHSACSALAPMSL